MVIVFACPGCGKQFKIDEDKAGRRGKCPACTTTFTIPNVPDMEPETPPPLRRTRPVQEEEDRVPLPQRPRPVDEQDEHARPRRRVAEDSADDTPEKDEIPQKRRKKKKKQGSSAGLIVLLATGSVGLLTLVGVGIWLLIRLAGSGATAEDLNYLPDNLHTFFTLNAERLTASDLYKRLKTETALISQMDQQSNGTFERSLSNATRITFGGGAGTDSWILVSRYKAVVDLNGTATRYDPPLPQQERIAGHQVRHNGTRAVALLDRKALLEGPLSTIRRVLERKGTKPSLTPALSERFKELDFSKLAALASVKAETPEGAGGTNLQAAVQGVPGDAVVGHLELSPGLNFTVVIHGKSAQAAEDAKKQIDGLLALARGPIPLPGAPPQLMEAAKAIQVSAAENRVTLSGTFDNKLLVELAKKVPNPAGR